MAIEDRDLLPAPRVVEGHLGGGRVHRLAAREDALGERMPHAIGVRVVDGPAHAVRAGVDRLSGERVGVKHEARLALVERGMLREEVAGQAPELLVEAAEDVVALEADAFDHLLVEVVEQLLARVALAGGDVLLEIALERVELELDLLGRPAPLVDDSRERLRSAPVLDLAILRDLFSSAPAETERALVAGEAAD